MWSQWPFSPAGLQSAVRGGAVLPAAAHARWAGALAPGPGAGPGVAPLRVPGGARCARPGREDHTQRWQGPDRGRVPRNRRRHVQLRQCWLEPWLHARHPLPTQWVLPPQLCPGNGNSWLLWVHCHVYWAFYHSKVRWSHVFLHFSIRLFAQGTDWGDDLLIQLLFICCYTVYFYNYTDVWLQNLIFFFFNLIESQEQPCRKMSSLMSSSKYQFNKASLLKSTTIFTFLWSDWNNDFDFGGWTISFYITHPFATLVIWSSHLTRLPAVQMKTFWADSISHFDDGLQCQPAEKGTGNGLMADFKPLSKGMVDTLSHGESSECANWGETGWQCRGSGQYRMQWNIRYLDRC